MFAPIMPHHAINFLGWVPYFGHNVSLNRFFILMLLFAFCVLDISIDMYCLDLLHSYSLVPN